MQGTDRSGEGGRRACLLREPGSELRPGGGVKKREHHELDGTKKNTHTHRACVKLILVDDEKHQDYAKTSRNWYFAV